MKCYNSASRDLTFSPSQFNEKVAKKNQKKRGYEVLALGESDTWASWHKARPKARWKILYLTFVKGGIVLTKSHISLFWVGWFGGSESPIQPFNKVSH